MKKITMILSAMTVCFFLAFDSAPVLAQDASHNTTATDDVDDGDDSDWGLLGLLGLIGLLGLKKRDRDEIHVDRTRPSSTSPTGAGMR